MSVYHQLSRVYSRHYFYCLCGKVVGIQMFVSYPTSFCICTNLSSDSLCFRPGRNRYRLNSTSLTNTSIYYCPLIIWKLTESVSNCLRPKSWQKANFMMSTWIYSNRPGVRSSSHFPLRQTLPFQFPCLKLLGPFLRSHVKSSPAYDVLYI